MVVFLIVIRLIQILWLNIIFGVFKISTVKSIHVDTSKQYRIWGIKVKGGKRICLILYKVNGGSENFSNKIELQKTIKAAINLWRPY